MAMTGRSFLDSVEIVSILVLAVVGSETEWIRGAVLVFLQHTGEYFECVWRKADAESD